MTARDQIELGRKSLVIDTVKRLYAQETHHREIAHDLVGQLELSRSTRNMRRQVHVLCSDIAACVEAHGNESYNLDHDVDAILSVLPV